ncbi:hypothetical protein G6F65_021723 [Rhizopus arrhizus]|nr:hypothetical protein G6F65_021723 [Rhizopus arrhizus]
MRIGRHRDLPALQGFVHRAAERRARTAAHGILRHRLERASVRLAQDQRGVTHPRHLAGLQGQPRVQERLAVAGGRQRRPPGQVRALDLRGHDCIIHPRFQSP